MKSPEFSARGHCSFGEVELFGNMKRRACHAKRERSKSPLRGVILDDKRPRYFPPSNYQGDYESASIIPAAGVQETVVEDREVVEIFKRRPPPRPVFFKVRPPEDSGSDVESVTGKTPEVPSTDLNEEPKVSTDPSYIGHPLRARGR